MKLNSRGSMNTHHEHKQIQALNRSELCRLLPVHAGTSGALSVSSKDWSGSPDGGVISLSVEGKVLMRLPIGGRRESRDCCSIQETCWQ